MMYEFLAVVRFKLQSSGVRNSVVLWVGNNFSEDPDASIFMLEVKMHVADSSPPTRVNDVYPECSNLTNPDILHY